MATIATVPLSDLQRERAFFFYMAVALAITAVIGFGFFIVTGHSNFGEPWFVHVHALTMMGWLALYLLQNTLVFQGNLAAHRKVGVVAAVWSAWMVPVGLAITAIDVVTKRTPPAFHNDFFLAMDWLTILLFGGLAWTAIALRNRRDWHKRLMLGATVNTIGPAWGRILPMPLLGQNGVLLILAILLSYLAVGMAFDRRAYGKVHPAYYWDAGLLAASFALIYPIKALPAFQELVSSLAA